MARRYPAIAFGEHVKAEQERYGSRRANVRREASAFPDGELGPEETAFLGARDTIYLATIGENGWPYVQLRGGPPGFVHVLDPATIAFADYSATVERVVILHVEAFDWNCPQHITPRFTHAEIAEALEPLRFRITALEAENVRLRERLGEPQAAAVT